MANVICHICLRTDITPVKISTVLTDFIDEICEFNIIDNPRYKYCTICAHLLKKFYNFKQRCLKACKILKSLKGTPKSLPTNLHKKIPSSIGFCSTVARYKLLEHKYETDSNLPETTPDFKSEPNITSNTEVQTNQQLETVDPIQLDPIQVKDEPMHDLLDCITTSDGYMTIDTNIEVDPQTIKLEIIEDVNTDTNKDDSKIQETRKDKTKPSKINDYLKSFEDEIREFEDDIGVDAEQLDVKDTTFMLNNDPLRDDESLNSMDDIESDVSDLDDKSLPDDESRPDDERNTDSDSDIESLTEFLETAKQKKIKVSEIYDLELAELLLKLDRKNKIIRKRVQFLKEKQKIKEGILKMFENDEYDLGEGVKMNKEAFLKMYERAERRSSYLFNAYEFSDLSDKKKTEEFLRMMFNIYNPEYETVFDIEYLDTEEQKLQEFNRRKDKAEYQNAPYKCTRCYKGFQGERLHAYHMKKHDESVGPHECHICSIRFRSKGLQRAHATYCHSAAYTCRQCHVSFYYFSSMQNHFHLHKGTEYPCPICNGIYRTATGLANHKRCHVTSHICTSCARSFVSAQGLLSHRSYKHKGAPEPGADAVRCNECLLILDSQKVYKRHMKISHRSHPYFCGCFESFSTLAELREHKVKAGHQHAINSRVTWQRKACPSNSMKRPTGDKKATRTCPICQEEVPNTHPTALYNHHEKHHASQPYLVTSQVRNLLCDECGKQFVSQSTYQDHKNIHAGIRPYKCPQCPRTCATKPHLQDHLTIHGPPRLKCKHCGKLFKKPSSLASHLRIHKNDRRYVCDICSASFIHAGSLTEHIKGVHQHQRRKRKNKET